jgi:multicomponent Na+:H+ antiporter subunit B
MNTVIFRTVAPYLAALTLLFSVFVLLRGHNEPGGGFIGGLIAASGVALYGISNGVDNVYRALYIHPIQIAAFGLFIASLSGFAAFMFNMPFMTVLWSFPTVFGTELALSTALIFDIGVYCVVVGAISTIALALEAQD